MSDDKQIEFVLGHPVTNICMLVATCDDWKQLTPDQFRMIARRLKPARHPEDLAMLAQHAEKLANPCANTPDDEVAHVLRSPVLRMLLSLGACSDTAWRRGIKELQATPDEIDRVRRKKYEIFDEWKARLRDPKH